MVTTFLAEPPPLRVDDGGVIRVGDSRVPLDVVVQEYEKGEDPEGIVHAYSALRLADVYGALWYYLRHREEIGAYLRRRQVEAAQLREKVEAAQGPSDLRERLLARRET
jgi:uncharacterized protein (DUF433 family)